MRSIKNNGFRKMGNGSEVALIKLAEETNKTNQMLVLMLEKLTTALEMNNELLSQMEFKSEESTSSDVYL